MHKAERTVEIDSNCYLMQVFNAINQDIESMVFVFQEIKFWREEYVLMVERDEQSESISDVFDFDEFKKKLLSRFT